MKQQLRRSVYVWSEYTNKGILLRMQSGRLLVDVYYIHPYHTCQHAKYNKGVWMTFKLSREEHNYKGILLQIKIFGKRLSLAYTHDIYEGHTQKYTVHPALYRTFLCLFLSPIYKSSGPPQFWEIHVKQFRHLCRADINESRHCLSGVIKARLG